MNSMLLACGKRPVSVERLRDAAERVELDLFQEFEDEVPTQAIGERVMRELHSLDTVAYVRFASVYREFGTLADFQKIVDAIQGSEPARR